jgi:alpha/beta superfamily hydrolase
VTAAPDRSDAAEPWAAAILLHPHPHMGGNRFHPMVEALYQLFPASGISVARFDLTSADLHEAAAQVTAAMDAHAEPWAGLPILLAGYSFGAGVAMGVTDPRIAGWYLIAPPLRLDSLESALGADRRPKGIAVPEHDQFSPPAVVAERTSEWRVTSTVVVEGADHFLAGVTGAIAADALRWAETVVRPTLPS